MKVKTYMIAVYAVLVKNGKREIEDTMFFSSLYAGIIIKTAFFDSFLTFSLLSIDATLSSYTISNSFRISPCSSDIRTVAFFPYSLHFSSFPSSSAIFLLISSGES